MTTTPNYACISGYFDGKILRGDSCTAGSGAPTQAGFQPGTCVVVLEGAEFSGIFQCTAGITISYPVGGHLFSIDASSGITQTG